MTFRIKVYLFLGVALCLFVDTIAKSVRSIHYNETGERGSPLEKIPGAIEICRLERNKKLCDKQQKECVLDRDAPAGFKCVCKEGEIEDESGKCVGICELDKNRKLCEEQLKECVMDRDETYGFRCVCKKGETEDGTGKCVDICDLDKNRSLCEEQEKVCIVDESSDDGFKCVCKRGRIEDGSGRCVDICELEENKQVCEERQKVCVADENSDVGFRCVCKRGQIDDGSGNCVVSCNTNDDCQNGAECAVNYDGSKYCKCLPGTEGDICDNVPECDGIACSTDSKCVYNVELEKAVCRCDDETLSFDPYTGSCKSTCNEDALCENGANCIKTETGSFCRCKIGTEGGLCEKVPECETKECGHESVCVYDVKLKRAVCRCNNPEKSYDPDNKLCKWTCNEDALCQNGGTCRNSDEGSYCVCETGTKGDLCDEVPECDNKECGEETKCVYDVNLKRPVCRCNNPEKSYDPDNNICKQPCNTKDDCRNGAECATNDDGLKYCQCKPGTEGGICEKIPECDTKVCGTDAECVYNIEQETVECQCNDKTLTYHPEIGKCRTPCVTDEDCKNGAECVTKDDVKYCKCNPGTVGDICEIVPECEDMDCGNEAKCGYSTRKKKAVCMCNDEKVFDPVTKTCKTPCEKDKDCKNGAQCVFKDGVTYCKCNPGTVGAVCEIVPECDDMDCGNEAKCGYSTRKKKAACICNHGRLFDPDTKSCKTPCELVEYQKKCYELQRECESDENEKEGYKCVCRNGQTEDSKGNCVDICEMERNIRKCEAVQRVCELDENESDGFKCVCKKGEVEDGRGKCAVCDCEENSFSCKYEDGKKVCDCFHGYSDNNGKCERCSCGRNSWSCNFEDGKKICDCLPGYGDKNGSCEDCDCGNDTLSCEFKDGKKSCVCDFGFKDNNGKCETCECGNNSFSCEFIDRQKVCNCHRFHGQKDGQCEICFCGIDIQTCRYNESGNKVCDCPEGYVEINGICEKISFPSTFTPTEITWNATRNSSEEHTSVFTTSYRNSTSSSTIRPTGADPCTENLCQNGGTCVIVDNKSKCLCKKPYLGILCETDPCDWNPCMNNGVCKIENEKVKCYCKEPFAGKYCESPIKLDAYVVTLVAASVFSAIVLIFVTCVLCQRCRVVGTS